jgi:hypothetical protein
MSNDYRIELAGTRFTVIDGLGEQVGTYPTEEAAKQDIERCKKKEWAGADWLSEPLTLSSSCR